MQIRWLPAAAEDLVNIHRYVLEDSPSQVDRLIQNIGDAIESLRQMPYRGRAKRRASERALILPKLHYVVTYRIDDESITILRIRHTARKPLRM